ncbi:hypothetical protein L0128_15070 [candidate division KSB1 bacterium]|nr:hypothetical protein [candidate division KSB1 bacterium]
MSLSNNPGVAKQGWLKNQVNQFTANQLAQRKSLNSVGMILRAIFAHWVDFFTFSLTFLAVFFFVLVILVGVEILFTDLTGVNVLAPLEALPEQETVVEAAATVSDSVVVATKPMTFEDGIRTVFGTNSEEYPNFISIGQFKLIVLINSIIALLVSLFVVYYYFFFLISEDGQTLGLRSGKIEILRLDGRELSSQGGIGGIGASSAMIYTIFYILFLPIFFILTKVQIQYSLLWSFIEGFKSLDQAIEGNNFLMNILEMLGYWVLSLVILFGIIVLIGVLFHLLWLLAGMIAKAVGKKEEASLLEI